MHRKILLISKIFFKNNLINTRSKKGRKKLNKLQEKHQNVLEIKIKNFRIKILKVVLVFDIRIHIITLLIEKY